LSPKEKAETLWLIALAAAAEVLIRVVSLPTLTRRLGISLDDPEGTQEPDAHGVGATPLTAAVVERRTAAVDRVYRAWPRHSSCLRRALVLGFYVRRARPLLRIGVARDGDEVRAHAWIEVDGRVLGEKAGEFAPLRPPFAHSR
jgi:hypothetical protein